MRAGVARRRRGVLRAPCRWPPGCAGGPPAWPMMRLRFSSRCLARRASSAFAPSASARSCSAAALGCPLRPSRLARRLLRLSASAFGAAFSAFFCVSASARVPALGLGFGLAALAARSVAMSASVGGCGFRRAAAGRGRRCGRGCRYGAGAGGGAGCRRGFGAAAPPPAARLAHSSALTASGVAAAPVHDHASAPASSPACTSSASSRAGPMPPGGRGSSVSWPCGCGHRGLSASAALA